MHATAALLALSLVAADRPFTELPYTPGLDPAAMDRSVDPCVDFYAYSCGGWQKRNPIPADQSSWSVYGKTATENFQFLWGLLETAAAKPDAERTPVERQVGDFFQACMDEKAIMATFIISIMPFFVISVIAIKISGHILCNF